MPTPADTVDAATGSSSAQERMRRWGLPGITLFGLSLVAFVTIGDTLPPESVAMLGVGLVCCLLGPLLMRAIFEENRNALEREFWPRQPGDAITEYLRSPEFADFDAWSARLALRVLLEEALAGPDIVAALRTEKIRQDAVRQSLVADDALISRIRIEQDRLASSGEERPQPRRRHAKSLTVRQYFVLFGVAVGGVGYLTLMGTVWPRLPLPLHFVAVAGLVGVAGSSAQVVVRRVIPADAMTARPQPHPQLLRLGDRQDALLAELIVPAIHEYVRAHRSVQHGIKLVHPGRPDLGESDGELVMTAGAERLRRIIERAESGAVALAGSRGVGKTTTIEAIQQGNLSTSGSRPLVVLASAPANYEARDFVLHLHALICQTVIDETSRELDLALPQNRRRRRAALRDRIAGLIGFLFFAASALGLALVLWGAPTAQFTAEIGHLGAAAVADLPVSAAVLWTGQPVKHIIALCLIGLVVGRIVWFTVTTPLDRLLHLGPRYRNRSLHELRRSAMQQLSRTRFLQTHTSGWSGKLTLPLKGEAGRTWSTQRAEQQLTHPEVVKELRSFAGKSAQTLREKGLIGRMIIAIDELDKMGEPEKAHQFINDVKGIFGVPGCLFFVSVSDDAVLNFEQRGLGVRDAFDSAFSEMVRLEHFTLDESRQWVASRVPGITEQFCYLGHCLSGGLPRELRRYTVEMIDVAAREHEPTLTTVTLALVRRDLANKVHALIGLLSTFPTQPEHLALTAQLLTIRETTNPLELARMAHDLVAPTVDTSVQPTDVVRWNAGCFTLFCATVLDVFNDSLDRDSLKREFHQLALARQQMSAHPQLAWQRIEDFRKAQGLEPVGGAEAQT